MLLMALLATALSCVKSVLAAEGAADGESDSTEMTDDSLFGAGRGGGDERWWSCGFVPSWRRSCSKRSRRAIISLARCRRFRGGAGVLGMHGMPSYKMISTNIFFFKKSVIVVRHTLRQRAHVLCLSHFFFLSLHVLHESFLVLGWLGAEDMFAR